MNDPIEELLMKYPPEIQVVARRLRSMVKQDMPKAYESIYHGSLSYSLSSSVFERLVYMTLEKNYVRLGFNFGVYLPDPEHRLVGQGKRLRHVKVYSLKDADQPALRQLVHAAWEHGNEHVIQMKKELLKNKAK